MYIIIYNGGIEGKHKRECGGRNHHLNSCGLSRGRGACLRSRMRGIAPDCREDPLMEIGGWPAQTLFPEKETNVMSEIDC